MDLLLPAALKAQWAIAHFLIPGISKSYLDFRKIAPTERSEDHYQKVAIRLHRVAQSFILRWSKIHIEKQLKRKYEHVLTCTLSNQQKPVYKDILFQRRALCMLPAVVAAPPYLYVANPPHSYSNEMKVFKFNLKEQIFPYFRLLQQIARSHFLQFPDTQLVQHDSGKMDALAVGLWKLKAGGHRVLILMQMIPTFHILELFHFLTYITVNASGAQSYLLSGVSHANADTVVFYDTDLNLLIDAKAKEWCDRTERDKDIHVYRLISGNSVEETPLKKGID
ncbi:E1A-binding protein p400-like [Apteryx rowi]|uniref:E1A-binding protein p400-like n=1 Tax=Apteryx rowi TaxID=308060 RepID=UPI000E1E1167|nr:E1A-binding protein p400-like [Apteryx rowi]